MPTPNGRHAVIDKRDVDAHRPLLLRDADGDVGSEGESGGAEGWQRRSGEVDLPSSLSDVVSEIPARDRSMVGMEVVRIGSFAWGVLSCLCAGSITAFSLYGPLFLSRLHYSQLRVNAVAVAAEIAMYLPVPLFGYLCDRYTPAPLSLLSGVFFGAGYLLAAFAYKSGPPPDTGGSGWPFWVMVLAFVGVGAGTCCMYLAAVTTCAKNFGRGRSKGIMLAVPIAAFGLSGMWQSQVGTHLLYERDYSTGHEANGTVDVFRYFLFLGILLLMVGIGGTFALRIVDEKEMIDEAVEELERSGVLGESSFFRSREEISAASGSYGTFGRAGANGTEDDRLSVTFSHDDQEVEQQVLKRKKNWLLNQETRLFLKDRTMWWLAGGFFLVAGPGEAYINNFGTIIPTLTSRSYPPNYPPPAGLPSTHVSTIALTSTIARLLTGSLSDLFAPTPTHLSSSSAHRHRSSPFFFTTFSRLFFLLPSALLLSLGFLILATPLPLSYPPLFHLTTALVGLGYGASFALVPIIISVVWGVENFGTNWGVVAMVPAAGAALWGVVYSTVYQAATSGGGGGERTGQCFGWKCYGYWALGCMGSVWVAVGLWIVAWKGWRRRGVVV